MIVIVFISSTLTFASDFFLTVNRSQQVVVEISNQQQTNNQNSFQFYNISTGAVVVKVYDEWTGYVYFQNTVNIPINYRVTAVLDNLGNMTIVSSQPLYGNSNTIGNVNYGNHHDGHHTNGKNNHNNYNTNKNKYFNQFVLQLKGESFDNNRLKTAKNYVLQNNLSADQIREIAVLFNFDNNRLEWTKAAYANCYDKGNYFLLKNTFSFESNYTKLVDYISKQ